MPALGASKLGVVTPFPALLTMVPDVPARFVTILLARPTLMPTFHSDVGIGTENTPTASQRLNLISSGPS